MPQRLRSCKKDPGICHFHRCSRIKDSNPVSNVERQINIMGDQDNCFSLIRQFPENLQRLQRHLQIQPRGRLIR